MLEAITFWNEPNNPSYWDAELDPEYKEFSRMVRQAAERVRQLCPALLRVLGGLSPIDPQVIQRFADEGLLESLNTVAVHGFPLDWSHWQIDDWPDKIAEIEALVERPVWVTEAGVASFGADEVQVFGLQRTLERLLGRVERLYWSSLLDLPPTWEATTRHRESEGSAYYRNFYLGLIRADGTPKPALDYFDPAVGIHQWFRFEDPRLEFAVEWLHRLGVKRLRTGISWADWQRPGALHWFDRQMQALAAFDTNLVLCFTPPAKGKRPAPNSPPLDSTEFAEFAEQVVERYRLQWPVKVEPIKRAADPVSSTEPQPLAWPSSY